MGGAAHGESLARVQARRGSAHKPRDDDAACRRRDDLRQQAVRQVRAAHHVRAERDLEAVGRHGVHGVGDARVVEEHVDDRVGRACALDEGVDGVERGLVGHLADGRRPELGHGLRHALRAAAQHDHARGAGLDAGLGDGEADARIAARDEHDLALRQAAGREEAKGREEVRTEMQRRRGRGEARAPRVVRKGAAAVSGTFPLGARQRVAVTLSEDRSATAILCGYALARLREERGRSWLVRGLRRRREGAGLLESGPGPKLSGSTPGRRGKNPEILPGRGQNGGSFSPLSLPTFF